MAPFFAFRDPSLQRARSTGCTGPKTIDSWPGRWTIRSWSSIAGSRRHECLFVLKTRLSTTSTGHRQQTRLQSRTPLMVSLFLTCRAAQDGAIYEKSPGARRKLRRDHSPGLTVGMRSPYLTEKIISRCGNWLDRVG